MLAVITARMIPTLTLHEIFWRLPYSTASWLFVQSARKNGVKGIGKKREDQALFRRWQFSPRTWGWSEAGFRRGEFPVVFPAHVGMVRFPPPVPAFALSFPRARGDGPFPIPAPE